MSILECLACDSTFHETDQTRSEQRDGLCPSCGYEDLKEVKPLEVDAFGIDIEALYDSQSLRNPRFLREAASYLVIETINKNLTSESKKRFEEYQEQNNPCR